MVWTQPHRAITALCAGRVTYPTASHKCEAIRYGLTQHLTLLYKYISVRPGPVFCSQNIIMTAKNPRLSDFSPLENSTRTSPPCCSFEYPISLAFEEQNGISLIPKLLDYLPKNHFLNAEQYLCTSKLHESSLNFFFKFEPFILLKKSCGLLRCYC